MLVFMCNADAERNSKRSIHGWRDVPLPPTGIASSIAAGRKFQELGLKFDFVCTSVMQRAVKCTWLACMESDNCSMPYMNSWRLNPRCFGELEWLTEEEIEDRFGDELFEQYFNNFNKVPAGIDEEDERHPSKDFKYKDVPKSALPKAESMAQVCNRILPFWNDTLAPILACGATVFLCAHKAPIRAILRVIEGLSDQDTLDLHIPAGVPYMVRLNSDLNLMDKRPLYDDVTVTRTASLRDIPWKSHSPKFQYDLIVIGGGPAGLAAAKEAGARGQCVALVDPSGYITAVPTGAHSKCLREVAMEGGKSWSDVVAVLEDAMKNAHHEAMRSIRTFHIKLLTGKGYILDENTVKITAGDGADTIVTTDAIIVATGSKANRFPPTNFELHGVFDSDTIQSISGIPEHLVIQGTGIVSVEYAMIFRKLGSKVTMFDAFGLFLPMLDSSVREAVRATVLASGIEISMNTKLTSVEAGEGSSPESPKIVIAYEAQDGTSASVTCDCLLSATGRHGLTYGIGLDNLESKGLKIAARGKLVEVDAYGYSGCAKVYAVGDCATGTMGLATMGKAQAVRAVRALYTKDDYFKTEGLQSVKPFGVWTIPDLAWAGMTEEAAKKEAFNYGVAQVKYTQTARGVIVNEDGFMKLVYNRDDGVVLGVHIFGEGSCELINFGADACERKQTIYNILDFVFPAVTYHNLYKLAACQAKIRLKGARNLTAAMAWKRLQESVKNTLERSQQTLQRTNTSSLMDIKTFLTNAFVVFDDDASGFLTKEQLKKAVESMGLSVTDGDVEEMIEEATGDPQEKFVDYQTFLEMLTEETLFAEDDSPEVLAERQQEKERVTKMCRSNTQSLNAINAITTKAADNQSRYDVIVIGGGPSGVRAAQQAGSRGKRVAIIDPKPVIVGIPTGAHSKCLREAVLDGATTWAEVQRVLESAVAGAHSNTVRVFKTFHIDHFKGTATIGDVSKVVLKENDSEGTRELQADNIVIATGSKANRFPPTNFDLPGVFDSDTIAGISRKPDVMVVQGAGIAGIEYAVLFAMLGTKVIVVDAFPNFCPFLDADLRRALRSSLDKNSVELVMNCPFKSVEAGEGSTPDSPKIKIDIGDRVLECDALFAATGRHGLTYGLGLEELEPKGLKVAARGKLVEVDANGYTGCDNIYAVGDCAVGSMGLATMGEMQAVRAVRAMFTKSGFFDKTKWDKTVHPSGVWTVPEIAWAGVTEEKAKADGIDCISAKVDFSHSYRGIISGESGFVKIVTNRQNGIVLGVHLCGKNACELVNFGGELVNARTTIFELLKFVFPTVTYHELYTKAATEAKIRLRGVKDVAAATAWRGFEQKLMKKFESDISGGCKETVNSALLHAFEAFDTDDSGFLSKEQLHDAVVGMNMDVSEDMISKMIGEAFADDGDLNEGIDYETFLKMLT